MKKVLSFVAILFAIVAVNAQNEFTYGFENDLEGWTVITVNADGGQWLHSSGNLGGYDYSAAGHNESAGFAMCYSYVDYDGAYNTDSYLVSPQQYNIAAGSTLNFWADNANDDYPENFSIAISTAANPTAADFTEIWNGGAKMGTAGNRYDNWREHTIDLSQYAGQNIWIAFHDVNYDAYEIWIDDVTITAGAGGGGTGIVENNNTLSIYPNPATSVLNVNAEGYSTIELVNMLGQVVYSANATSNMQVNVSNLDNGVYFVRLNGANGTATQKFIKK